MTAFIAAARRTAVVPREGAFRAVEAHDLAAPVIRAVLDDAGLAADQVDEVILGNALYGGGNPARMAALKAGLPDDVAAMTIDTHCCAGLDAIMLATGQAPRVAARAGDFLAILKWAIIPMIVCNARRGGGGGHRACRRRGELQPFAAALRAPARAG